MDKSIVVLHALQSFITGLEDTNNDAVFKEILTREENQFDGDPNCTITLRSSPAEEIMDRANKKEDTYRITIYVSVVKNIRTSQEAWDKAQELQAQVADLIDRSNYLGGMADLLHPRNLFDINNPVSGSGDSVIAEIEVVNERIVVF